MRICAYKGFIMLKLVNAAKAISDETRLRILNLLLARECCVCEVTQALEISQTRASRNLNILYNAGFLKLRRDGLWAYYSIDKKSLDAYLIFLLNSVTAGLQRDRQARFDLERLTKLERAGTCIKSPVRKKVSLTASGSKK